NVAPPAPGATSWTGTFDWTAGTDDIATNGLPISGTDVVYFHQGAHGVLGSGAMQASTRNATNFAKVTDLTVNNGVALSRSVAVDTDYGTVTYGQFLDAPWSVKERQLQYETRVSFAAPGASPSFWPLFYVALEDETAVAGSPAAPLIGPVGAPQINGLDAFAAHTAVGVQPVLSWSAPSLGTPTSYAITIDEVANSAGATVFNGVLFAVV